eukprot:SAG11_NODE_6058_length_1398_cov_1.438029_2_plen_116_part_00
MVPNPTNLPVQSTAAVPPATRAIARCTCGACRKCNNRRLATFHNDTVYRPAIHLLKVEIEERQDDLRALVPYDLVPENLNLSSWRRHRVRVEQSSTAGNAMPQREKPSRAVGGRV